MTFISIHLSPALHPKPNPTPNPYNPEPAAMVIGTQASGALVLATAHQAQRHAYGASGGYPAG